MEEKILTILKKVLGVEDIDSNCSQSTCENWDSLRHLNLIVELEFEFDVEFEPEEIAQMKTAEEIKKILTSK